MKRSYLCIPVTANVTSYMNVLTYKPTQRGFYQTPFNQAIVCTYTKPAGWTPPVYNPALGDASGFGKLEFTMGIMNDDFSAPRTSSLFFLGSPINIAAAVKQQFHMPLMVYMEECCCQHSRAEPFKPDLPADHQPRVDIHCKLCFVDGQAGNSRFLPRVQTSEIRLVVQAFRFTQLNTDVYIHCRLLAWDPAQLNDPTKKACSFNQRTRSWELLDDPGRSSVCSCCTAKCNFRKRRDTEHQQVLAWLPGLAAPLLLIAVLGALSLGYYIVTLGGLGRSQRKQDLFNLALGLFAQMADQVLQLTHPAAPQSWQPPSLLSGLGAATLAPPLLSGCG
ncbi:UNVERIFIED_CONTAM: hypothetical protein FKN15_001346 [Acipenser sinensis]